MAPAEGAETVFGVILGTGVGGGIVVRGRVLAGANRVAGEWGHNPLPLPDEESLPPAPCYCGRCGCVETWLSGPALAADHLRHGGEALTAPQIASHASDGDAACEATLRRYERRLAKALAVVVNILDPDAIVLGGGLSNIDRLYRSVPQTVAAAHLLRCRSDAAPAQPAWRLVRRPRCRLALERGLRTRAEVIAASKPTHDAAGSAAADRRAVVWCAAGDIAGD
jgi:predicted NBD/HSP70 family sugar kinase